jgi:hypothetical protein
VGIILCDGFYLLLIALSRFVMLRQENFGMYWFGADIMKTLFWEISGRWAE